MASLTVTTHLTVLVAMSTLLPLEIPKMGRGQGDPEHDRLPPIASQAGVDNGRPVVQR